MSASLEGSRSVVRLRSLHKKLGARFDGNLSGDLSNFMFANEDFEGIDEEQMKLLIARTEQGHLAWAIFPPAGYRL